MKLLLLIILSLTASIANAQSRVAPDGRAFRDTNAVVYNEAGKIVKYWQYKNLLESGEYIMTRTGDPLLPGSRFIVRKLTEKDKQRTADVMDGFILNAGVLKLNSQLDATPLATALQKDFFNNKVILMVFSNPGCLPCGDMFAQINSTITDFGTDSLVVLFITQNTEEKAAEAFSDKPLANARIVARATSTKEFYGITGLPAFVIADQNRTIRYNGVGIGPSRALQVKNVLNEMRGHFPDGYYSLTYDQKHMMLSLKATKLVKEGKFHEAAEVYESLFIHSMGKGIQQDYYNAASVWANLGDSDKAFHYLNQVVFVSKYTSLPMLNSEANFHKLKSDRRWKTITDGVNKNVKEKISRLR